MNFDKDKLIALTALPDDALWSEIKKMSSAYGLSLPDKTPSHEELEKLRSMFGGVGKLSLMQAMRVVNDIKRRGNK